MRALFFFVHELLPVYTSGKERLRPDRRRSRGRRRLLAEGGAETADYARWGLVWLLGPGRWGKRGREDRDGRQVTGARGDLVRIDDGLASEVNLQLGAALLIVVAGAVAKGAPFGCVVKGASLAARLRVARRSLARL